MCTKNVLLIIAEDMPGARESMSAKAGIQAFTNKSRILPLLGSKPRHEERKALISAFHHGFETYVLLC